MEMREVFGLGFGLLVLAGVSMAIVNGSRTAKVVQSFTQGFADDISVATFQNSNFQQGS